MQKAFVLHIRSYRETSLLVELLTETLGRCCVIARGVRNSKEGSKGLLQPFTPLLLAWRGKGDLPTLTRVENDGSPVILSGKQLVSGLYLNELLIRLLHRYDPVESIFVLYEQTLRALVDADLLGIQKVLRIFEKKLLNELGYGLQLQYEAQTHRPIEATKEYIYLHEQGFFEASHQSLSQKSYSGSDLLAILQDDYSELRILNTAKRLMQHALRFLLGNQPLRSRELWFQDF